MNTTNTIENEADIEPTLTLVCSKHGAQEIDCYAQGEASIILTCGCQWHLNGRLPRYEGNLHQGDFALVEQDTHERENQAGK